jgi:tetraacyldisaccharide 4'-kinase
VRTPTHILARLALWPLSAAYRRALGAREALYRRGWARVERVPVPVVSIGNLSVGGTGKTPLVEKLCGLLHHHGLRPAVVSRGYRRRGGESLTVVSRGDGRGPAVPVEAAGDEPYLLAAHLPGAIVVVGADRVGAARAAVDLGAGVVIADDAFQHRRLARDVDLLAIDATNPTEAGWLLPAGRLREPLEAARRATGFLITRCDKVGETTSLRTLYRRHNPTAPFFQTATRPTGLLLPDGREAEPQQLRDEGVIAFCGIGRPDLFVRDLERLGARVRALLPFPDHHWFADGDLEAVAEKARAAGVSAIVTTEKDFVRLSEEQRRRLPLHRLRIEAEIWEERQLTRFLLRGLGARIEGDQPGAPPPADGLGGRQATA